MGTEYDSFKVRNLANNNLSHASKDTYLICQRLDKIIALLEYGQRPTQVVAEPDRRDYKTDMAIAAALAGS